MGTPLFVASQTHAIAICRAEGDSRLVETVQENLGILDPGGLTGFGLILDADADKKVTAADRYQFLHGALANLGHALPNNAGTASAGPPRTGAYVLPDNTSPGTLEDLLLECAATAYPTLLASAQLHVGTAVSDTSLTSTDTKDLKKPSGRKKATVGSVAAILRPGRAIQVSLQDNQWLRGDRLDLPKIKAVQSFQKDLFGVVT